MRLAAMPGLEEEIKGIKEMYNRLHVLNNQSMVNIKKTVLFFFNVTALLPYGLYLALSDSRQPNAYHYHCEQQDVNGMA